MKKFTLIGSGLVGSLLSIYLSKRGHKVSMYESRPDLRTNRISAGRSINLALSDRGWRGLEKVGVADDVRKVALPMKGRIMHGVDSSLSYQPYGKDDQAIYSVSRGGLNCVLMDLAEKHGVEIFYNEKCSSVDFRNGSAVFENFQTKNKTVVQADHLIASDGAGSVARLQMQLSTERFQYSQQFLEHGYKELTIPPTATGDFAMDPTALHIWPRGTFMLIALPNLDKSFTCTLFFPFDGEYSFNSLTTEGKMMDFFQKTFPDAVPLMPTLKTDYFSNPSASLGIIRCFPWSYEDKLLLVGDAAHAIVPFYGQGMNCGFEDCVVFDKLMDTHGDDWKTIFRQFESLRKPDGDAIADLAVSNFIEMRDKVGQKEFLLQKKIEAWFSSKYPEKWIPLYTMVTFSPDIRYSEAKREGERQESIMKKVMALDNIEAKWNSEEVEKLMLELLNSK
jgi:kynurenine 3-monooxygenase